eukprot:3350357-Amphidinium_carterae.2
MMVFHCTVPFPKCVRCLFRSGANQVTLKKAMNPQSAPVVIRDVTGVQVIASRDVLTPHPDALAPSKTPPETTLTGPHELRCFWVWVALQSSDISILSLCIVAEQVVSFYY